MSLKVYGIPTCGTCKKAIQWLEANGVTYEFINTKDYPPSRQQIQGWVNTLGAKAMRNTSGKSYRSLGEEKKSWTDVEWIDAFAQDAMLIKRPLFAKDDIAVLVGFRASEEVLRKTLE